MLPKEEGSVNLMILTDNPHRDFYRYDAEMEDRLKNLPVCAYCNEPIQQESAVCVDDDWICDRCLEDLRRGICLD